MIIKPRVAEPTSTEIKLSRELSVDSLKLWAENKKTLFRIKLNFNSMWLMVENVWNELDESERGRERERNWAMLNTLCASD